MSDWKSSLMFYTLYCVGLDEKICDKYLENILLIFFFFFGFQIPLNCVTDSTHLLLFHR